MFYLHCIVLSSQTLSYLHVTVSAIFGVMSLITFPYGYAFVAASQHKTPLDAHEAEVSQDWSPLHVREMYISDISCTCNRPNLYVWRVNSIAINQLYQIQAHSHVNVSQFMDSTTSMMKESDSLQICNLVMSKLVSQDFIRDINIEIYFKVLFLL